MQGGGWREGGEECIRLTSYQAEERLLGLYPIIRGIISSVDGTSYFIIDDRDVQVYVKKICIFLEFIIFFVGGERGRRFNDTDVQVYVQTFENF
jgi:hypothetical protein